MTKRVYTHSLSVQINESSIRCTRVNLPQSLQYLQLLWKREVLNSILSLRWKMIYLLRTLLKKTTMVQLSTSQAIRNSPKTRKLQRRKRKNEQMDPTFRQIFTSPVIYAVLFERSRRQREKLKISKRTVQGLIPVCLSTSEVSLITLGLKGKPTQEHLEQSIQSITGSSIFAI